MAFKKVKTQDSLWESAQTKAQEQVPQHNMSVPKEAPVGVETPPAAVVNSEKSDVPAQFADLEKDIQNAYEGGVTMDEAEKLAAKFLGAMMRAAARLRALDLDARMKKSGVKAVRAAIYLAEATKGEKKPSDVLIGAIVDSSKLVQDEQGGLDTAEVRRDELERYFGIFKEAHVYFRGISKGKYE